MPELELRTHQKTGVMLVGTMWGQMQAGVVEQLDGNVQYAPARESSARKALAST